MGRAFAGSEPAAQLEDLADRHVGEDPHGQDDPEDDLVSQRAWARIDPAGRRERLSEIVGADNLGQSRDPIENPARCVGRQGAVSLWHASHGLRVASVVW